MRKIGQIALALLTCVYSLYVLPASAGWGATSGNMRPVAGKTMVYESYISNEGCVAAKGNKTSTAFTGGATVFMGDSNIFTSGKPVDLKCDNGYAMVNMTSQSSGYFQATFGGQINNTGSASCCPIKYRWVAPKAAA